MTGNPVQYIVTTTAILNKSSGSGRLLYFFIEDSVRAVNVSILKGSQ